MAFPPGDGLNRKSRLGHRQLARTPRAHQRPFFTNPPIASEDSMEAQQQNDEQSQPIVAMRRIMRSLVVLVAPSDIDPEHHLVGMLDEMDDARLAGVGQEALSVLTRSKKLFDNFEAELTTMRKELERVGAEHKQCERAVADGHKAVRERDDIAAKYRELQKQLDPEAAQLRTLYAIDEATAGLNAEITRLRVELDQRQTEINNLRASKKRLREALDRLAAKD